MNNITGKEIKKLRKRLNLTQQQLADRLGVARITIIRWEADSKKASNRAKRELARLANKNGVGD